MIYVELSELEEMQFIYFTIVHTVTMTFFLVDMKMY